MGSIVRSMPLGVFLVMLAFPLAMAAIVVVAGVTARRRAALVKATPTSYIATAGDGYAQFEGRAEAIERQTLRAALTGTPCVWYHAKVESLRPRGRHNDPEWTTIGEVTSDAPFLIRDDGGRCAIHPYRAEVTPTDKSLWYGSTKLPEDRNPPRVKPTENPRGLVEVTGGSRRYRYSEERIYDGDPLLVLGSFTRAVRRDEDDDEDFDDAVESSGSREAAEAEAEAAEDEVDLGGDEEAVERLYKRAPEVTTSVISRGTGPQPFVLTTTPKAMHIELSERGGMAAMAIALVPLGLAALMLWARFG